MHNEQMTSRERFIAAMERRTVDRVPVQPCLWFNHIANVAGVSYADILLNPEKMYDAAYRARQIYDADGMRVLIMPPPDWREGTVGKMIDGVMTLVREKTDEPVATFDEKGGGAVRLIDNGAHILDRIGWPVNAHVETVQDVLRLPIPSSSELIKRGQLAQIDDLIKRINRQHFIFGLAGMGCCMNQIIRLRGAVQGLMDLVEQPAMAHAICEVATQLSIEQAKALVDVGIDGIWFGDSAASSSMISPEHYKKFCQPYYRRFVETIRAYNPNVKLCMHCCGNYNPTLEMAADEGVDALHGMDPTEGMVLSDIVRRVGDKACIFGGVNTLTLLNGTPDDVTKESLACIDAAGKVGYILDAACAVPPASPFENVKAMCMAPRLTCTPA